MTYFIEDPALLRRKPSGLGLPPIPPEALAALPEVLEKAEGYVDKFAKKMKDIADAAPGVWATVTGRDRDQKRRNARSKANQKGTAWVASTYHLYNRCFGVSDWFRYGQRDRDGRVAPPTPNRALSDPRACCELLATYRNAEARGLLKHVGERYGAGLRYQGEVISERINPIPYFDRNMGGAPARYWSDLPSRGWKNIPMVFPNSGVGCRPFEQRAATAPTVAAPSQQAQNFAMTSGGFFKEPITLQPFVLSTPGTKSMVSAPNTQERNLGAQRTEEKSYAVPILVGALAIVGTVVFMKRKG